MTRDITQEDFLATTAATLSAAQNDSFVISKNGEFVAALISEEDYAELRKVRASRAIAAMNRISDAIERSGASEEDLRELEKALDRHI